MLQNILFAATILQSSIIPQSFIARLQSIDHLIQKRNTGNAAARAVRLEVSKRTAKEFIAVMKGLGVDEK